MYDFLETFTKYINKISGFPIYNGKSMNDQNIYGVISNPIETPLRYGTQIFFDIFIWANEDTKYSDIIQKSESLRKQIDKLHLKEKVYAVIYAENVKTVDDKDYKKIKAQISCEARVMSE